MYCDIILGTDYAEEHGFNVCLHNLSVKCVLPVPKNKEDAYFYTPIQKEILKVVAMAVSTMILMIFPQTDLFIVLSLF